MGSDDHTYPEPDDEEGFLYAREWEDQHLVDEFRFTMALLANMTEAIRAGDAELYELVDEIYRQRQLFNLRRREDEE